ncbi:sulfotransferase [Erythrobacter sp.]|uniref:tetratricopeptide repeat-containing sulfotransferase family protein n=1 Tax=Erythrobacter sp. TaxID=1042 RepID=UPI001B1AF485|nr:sulfotransferase [Erythrobacter sp.]MBO6526956.1 sulfotransferase [Erythrobacter sp.]MBO6528628.1 sulfotransferase [Erythrobacter sp.]
MMTSLERDGRLTAATQAAMRLLEEGSPQDAADTLGSALRGSEGNRAAWLVQARAQQRLSNFADMAESAAAARKFAPNDRIAQNVELEALILRGDIPAAKCRIMKLAEAPAIAASRLDELAQSATKIGDYALTESLLHRACRIEPDHSRFRFNLAAAQVALGKLDMAERNLHAVTRTARLDGEARYNLSTLRTRTAQRNNLSELTSLLPLATGRRDGFALHFALAKELEDLGRHAESYSALENGNALRRAAMRYRVEGDSRTMARIAEAYRGDWAAGRKGHAGAAPIFVVGMPRSGTTLVDRILSSHPEVESVGEVNDLALAIMEEAPPVTSKDELVVASARTSPDRIGANYARRMRWRATSGERTVDKTPLNFLYLGLIAQALPEATIVHVRRDPMDIAFAVYKTLFRMGYPFAYSLDDIGDYLIAKHRLMTHWQEQLGERIVQIDYEDLVSDQEGESRKLLESAGLAWDDRVLEFHRDHAPTATASAAQVRQPIHTKSVGAWRRHGDRLAGLQRRLRDAGLLA